MEELWDKIDNNWVAIIFVIVGVLEALINSGLIEAMFSEAGPAIESFLTLIIPVIAAPIARQQAFGKRSMWRERRQRHGH